MNITNNNENTELKCELCGKTMTKPAFTGEYKNVCHDCFNDKFWMLKIRDVNKAPEKFETIKNNLYYIADENDNDSFRGFDGRKFIIKYNDGRQIITTNMWHNGTIPEKFRDKLPDNAIFINGD